MSPTQIRYTNARILEKGKTAFVLYIPNHLSVHTQNSLAINKLFNFIYSNIYIVTSYLKNLSKIDKSLGFGFLSILGYGGDW